MVALGGDRDVEGGRRTVGSGHRAADRRRAGCSQGAAKRGSCGFECAGTIGCSCCCPRPCVLSACLLARLLLGMFRCALLLRFPMRCVSSLLRVGAVSGTGCCRWKPPLQSCANRAELAGVCARAGARERFGGRGRRKCGRGTSASAASACRWRASAPTTGTEEGHEPAR